MSEKEHDIHFHSFNIPRKDGDPQTRVGWTADNRPCCVGESCRAFVRSQLLRRVFELIGRVSNHPVRSFRIVGGIALVVSFLNPLLQLAGHWLPATGMNLPIFWTMIVMHCVSALITISLLTTLAVEQ